MKVLFTSYDLRSLNFELEPVEFETAPLIGDRIQIDKFVTPDQKKLIEECLESQKRIISGEVNTRIWTKIENENALMLSLTFDEYTESDEILVF